jgi:hypothetical protein
MTSWGEVIRMCLTTVQSSILSNSTLMKVDLPPWKNPQQLDSDWWAWGLLQARSQFYESGNFLLKLLLLPPVLKGMPLRTFSKTSAINLS